MIAPLDRFFDWLEYVLPEKRKTAHVIRQMDDVVDTLTEAQKPRRELARHLELIVGGRRVQNVGPPEGIKERRVSTSARISKAAEIMRQETRRRG